MGEAEMGSMLKQALKNLCCSNGWSYGVFWHFNQKNTMLLTMEEAYYEEQMRPLVDSMLLKFHILGEGIIGQVAFTGKHQWIFSDSPAQGSDFSRNQIIFQGDSDIKNQFSSGIKTIAIISVEGRGVVQFGSSQKILERSEFLDETKKLFYAMGSYHGLTSLETETCNLDGLFASLASSGNFYNEILKNDLAGSHREPERLPCSMQNLTESSGFVHGIEAQTTSFGKVSHVNSLAGDTPCTSTWSSEGSILTSFETSLPSEKGLWESAKVLPKKSNDLVLCGNMEQNLHGGSTFTSFYSTGELVDAEFPALDSLGQAAGSQNSFGTNGELLDSVINLQRITEEFNPANCTTDLSTSFTLDDLSQWFSSSTQHNINEAGATMASGLSCSTEVTSVPATLVGDTTIDIPVRQAANSIQSSITDALISNVENSTNIVPDNGNDLFNGVGQDSAFGKSGEFLEDIIMPLLHNDNYGVTSGISESTSEMDVQCMSGKRKGLFSELGLEELLHGVSSSVTNSNVEDQYSNSKRSKSESSSSNFHQGQFMGLSYSGGSMNQVHHSQNWDKSNNNIFNKAVHPKSPIGAWINDSYSANAGHAAAATSKKPTKKRAKPGESTRPRPKDRQLIQDRIKELRGIIPHTGKQLSIDHLLERTIKYLLFLQAVTKYADKIKQADEPKLVGQENGMLPKHNKMNGGTSWAFELGAQSIPLVVKDLNSPGQMLIEMLCEDRGFFLEIADVIRSNGLNILKGVMELQKDKIWARFIVEANEHMERTKIILSLLTLQQQKHSSGIDSASQPSNTKDDGISLLNNYQQPLLMPHVNMAQILQ